MSMDANGSSSRETKGLETQISSTASEEHQYIPVLPREGLWSNPKASGSDLTRLDEDVNKSNSLIPNVPDLSGFGVHAAPVREFFSAMQKWTGFVTEVGHETFKARITTVVGEGHVQDAEIYISEVDMDDRPLVKQGAIFYWSIGYLDRPSGRLRISVLRFRRLPAWTAKDVESTKDTLESLRALFDREK